MIIRFQRITAVSYAETAKKQRQYDNDEMIIAHCTNLRIERFGLSRHARLYFGSIPKLRTDEQLLKHLEERAPEVLAAKVNFDALVGKVLAAGSVDTGRAPKHRKKRDRSAKAKPQQRK